MKKRRVRTTATGMNLTDALILAEDLGFRVRTIRQSGELLMWHPYFPTPVKLSARRRDCPRSLSHRINQMLTFDRN
jgi:hypothetical protein